MSRRLFTSACALLVALAVGWAAPAAACGMCLDVNLQARWWWAPLQHTLAPLLLLEIFVTAIAWRLMRYAPRVRRGRWVLVAIVVGVALSLAVGGSAAVLSAGMLLVLLPLFARSIMRELNGAGRVVRLLGVLLPAAVFSYGLLPSQRDTEELVALATLATRLPPADGWLHDELRRRADAVPLVEESIQSAPLRRRAMLVRMHGRLAPAERHQRLCGDLIANAEEGQLKILEAACGGAAGGDLGAH